VTSRAQLDVLLGEPYIFLSFNKNPYSAICPFADQSVRLLANEQND